jgi:hypothetical protein
MGLSQQESKKVLETLYKDIKKLVCGKDVKLEDIEKRMVLARLIIGMTEEKKKKKKSKSKKRKISDVTADDASTASADAVVVSPA